MLDSFGSYLGIRNGNIFLKDKDGNTKKWGLFERNIGEVQLVSGNTVSTGLLTSLGFWNIDVLVCTKNGFPVAMLKNLDSDNANAKTVIGQVKAQENGKGFQIAKELVKAKIKGSNLVLIKNGLRPDYSGIDYVEDLNESNPVLFRRKLLSIEGKQSELYFRQIFDLFPREIRPVNRKCFKAYDGVNNTFNLAYTLLKYKCHRALLSAHLQPFIGYLHQVQFGRPSLVCDFMEVYRYLVDSFLIDYCKTLKPKDFTTKEEMFNGKKGVSK